MLRSKHEVGREAMWSLMGCLTAVSINVLCATTAMRGVVTRLRAERARVRASARPRQQKQEHRLLSISAAQAHVGVATL